MLNKHLTVKTRPQAVNENYVYWLTYRITVLGSCLFRLENSPNLKWRDCATQAVWFRDAVKQDFTAEENDKDCVIVTKDVRLVLKPKRSDCYVILGGNEIKLDNAQNLLGTYRTLDCCDGDTVYENWYYNCAEEGKVKLGYGVCAKNGVAVLNDEQSLSLDENGKILPQCGDGTDEYIFAFGSDYRKAVKALYEITGFTPMLPRFALGNWWSRFYPYSENSYLTLMDKFANRSVPFTVATVDMDWHYSEDVDMRFKITELGRNTDFYGGNNGWTGYSWNKDLFPDYKHFLKELKKRNLKVTLNVHPADGVRWFEDKYKEMAESVGIDYKTLQRVPFDVTDDNFINKYFSVLHKPLEKDGVAFWWLDWQQGTQSKMGGLDPLWSLNHYHYLDNAKNNVSALILSRYCGLGAHRYPVGFSGDTYATWKTLKYLPYFTATASNIGYTWWSHDIGGHMWGKTDGELYLRFVQYGVFSPINRLHCCGIKVVTKEPLNFGNGLGLIAEEFLRFRHRLIPFLYTANYLTHKNGKALVEPLYYEYAQKDAYESDGYMFGGLLVFPVTQPVGDDGYAKVEAWLPQGKYTDIFTREEYVIETENGERLPLLRKLDSIPVLAKSGTVLPLSLDGGNSVDNPKNLEIKIYSGTGEYTLYEDGDDGEYFTQSKLTEKSGELLLEICGNGNPEVIPKNRTLKISFENIYRGVAEVYKSDKKLNNKQELIDNLTVKVKYEHGAKYTVVVRDLNGELENLKLRLTKSLTEAEDNVFDKDICFKEIIGADSIKEISKIIENCGLKEITKMKLKEAL